MKNPNDYNDLESLFRCEICELPGNPYFHDGIFLHTLCKTHKKQYERIEKLKNISKI